MEISIVNPTMELRDCRGAWFFDEKYGCWCLEDVLYTEKADVPKFQRLSVFAPKACMNPDGTPTEESRSVPVVFENNSAGYMQMRHPWLGGPHCYAEQYLNHGLVYVTCGCRGRESVNGKGEFVGKSPISLVDLKTALRFLRHNRAALPGDWDRVVSVGWSAGGAMSALLGVTGDNSRYDRYLDWDYVRDEMERIVATCRKGGAICKVIFENCYLTKAEIVRLAEIAREVRPDFIKTSTGFGTGGATVEDVKLMYDTVQGMVKVKAAGGIRDWVTCRAMIEAGAVRIGTSAGLKILAEFCEVEE